MTTARTSAYRPEAGGARPWLDFFRPVWWVASSVATLTAPLAVTLLALAGCATQALEPSRQPPAAASAARNPTASPADGTTLWQKLSVYRSSFRDPNRLARAQEKARDTLPRDPLARRFHLLGRRDGRRLFRRTHNPNVTALPLPARLLPTDSTTRLRVEAAYAAGFNRQAQRAEYSRRTGLDVSAEAAMTAFMLGLVQAAVYFLVLTLLISVLVAAILF